MFRLMITSLLVNITLVVIPSSDNRRAIDPISTSGPWRGRHEPYHNTTVPLVLACVSVFPDLMTRGSGIETNI